MKTIFLNDAVDKLEIGSQRESTRVCALLKAEGIGTVKELCRRSKMQLRSINQIGELTIWRIEDELKRHGLSLDMSDWDIRRMEQREDQQLADAVVDMPEGEAEADNEQLNEQFRTLVVEQLTNLTEIAKKNVHIVELIVKCIQLISEHVSSKASMQDWERIFKNVATDEYLSQNHLLFTDEQRAQRAIKSARTLTEALKEEFDDEKKEEDEN